MSRRIVHQKCSANFFANPLISLNSTTLIAQVGLKWIYSWPENRAEGLRIQSLINSQMQMLNQRSKWGRIEFEKWKIRQLGILVDWAFETTEIYRQKYEESGYKKGEIRSPDDFSNLPNLNRNEIVDSFPDRIVSKNYDSKKCKWYFSSGSSGSPVQLIADPERSEIDTLHRHRMFESMAGQHFPKDRWIYNINHAHWWHTSFN